jgi:tetratricopeptide (TPR) repeat protein
MIEDVEKRVRDLEEQAEKLLNSRRLEEAQRVVESAIRLVEMEKGSESARLLPLLRLLTKILTQPHGAHDDRSVAHILRALMIARAQRLDDRTLSGIYGQAGGCLHAAGRLAEAREMQEHALALAERSGVLGEVTFHLLGLALVVNDINKEEAAPLWKRLANLEEREQADSLPHMMALAHLARCLIGIGRGEEAVIPLEGALRILEAHTQGATSPWTEELRNLLEKARSDPT